MKFRKRPIVVTAWRFDGSEMPVWVRKSTSQANPSSSLLKIVTLEGAMTAYPGDWIIQGIAGEVYPCRPDIFEATYEPWIDREETA